MSIRPRPNGLHAGFALAGVVCLLGLCALGCASSGGDAFPVARGLSRDGPHAYRADRNFLTNHLPRNADHTINVVVEIPAGTSEKWEVDDADGHAIVRDFTGESPRVVDYLPYPGNYGLIPRTLLAVEQGGDGGALDVMVLGPAVPRGQVVRARPIGIVRIVDRMEQDDKILAVMQGETLQSVYDLESLRARYPGAADILTIWWTHAHGQRSEVDLLATGSRGQANAVIDQATDAWKARQLELRRETEAAEETD